MDLHMNHRNPSGAHDERTHQLFAQPFIHFLPILVVQFLILILCQWYTHLVFFAVSYDKKSLKFLFTYLGWGLFT